MIAQLAPTLPARGVVLVVAPAAAAAATALVAGRVVTVTSAWRLARMVSVVIGLTAVAVAVLRATHGDGANGFVRVDTVTAVMLGLISIVGWVVVRYSATYLAGDPHQRRYVERLLATLGAVLAVVVANNLLLLVAAWAGASFALHGLLTFLGDRRVAIAVAHKKFVLARCADVCMLGAVVAFATTFDTLRIDAIGADAMAGSLPAGARIGILLVAVAALLKCAQLPFHGWLIQVMEAPTPVSALLHAGVVNLGGFVLLRFAPVVDRAVETRALLVIAGTLTAVIAALVMTTRVSVKVALAWSTCAQMGFMLMQCGLGLWEMAMVHLLAHSVYKAHAFLGAGGTVRQTQRNQLATKEAPPTLRSVVAGAGITLAATATIALAWQSLPFTKQLSVTMWLMLGIVALAVVPLIRPFRTGGHGGFMVLALAVPVAYLALHELAARLIPTGPTAPVVLVVFTGLGFAALFVVQSVCAVAPTSAFARRIRPWIYAGLFLDDSFTRLAFTVSPPPAPTSRPNPLPQPLAVAVVRTISPVTTPVQPMDTTHAQTNSSIERTLIT